MEELDDPFRDPEDPEFLAAQSRGQALDRLVQALHMSRCGSKLILGLPRELFKGRRGLLTQIMIWKFSYRSQESRRLLPPTVIVKQPKITRTRHHVIIEQDTK